MLQLEAYAKGDRHELLRRAQDALSSAGAWILDSHLFSGMAVAIVFETARQDLSRLLAGLRQAGFAVDDPGPLESPALPSETVVGTLRLNFIDGDPSVRRVVPAVPG